MTNILKKIIPFILFLWIILPGILLAQSSGGTQNPPPGTTSSGGTQNPPLTTAINPVIKNPLNSNMSDIPSIINAVMRGVIMPLASILVVLALLYSGFKFVIARGNPTEIQKAREGLLWVLIGSAVLLGAYGISEFVKGTINQIVDVKV
jgi:hypothetical protein